MNTPQIERSALLPGAYNGTAESSKSAVSWAAILAGAVVAASVSLILVAIGSGLDLLSVSPWSGSGVSLTTFTALSAIWFIVIQWVASGVGGYLTGRLRTRWVDTHTHEVFFRDTAHGFVTWALASILAALLFASAAASLTSGATHAAALAAGLGPRGATMGGSYDLDVLFRSAGSDANGPSSVPDPRPEALRLMANGLSHGDVPPSDRTYLASVVAAHTGISQSDAEQRVDVFIAQSKEAADKGRKATAAFAIFTAISMLIGAFIACVAAALGGQRRDFQAVSAR
jgi:hypothetical protein